MPERSTASAWSIDSAWVTAAPRSIAILVAVVSWPLSVPTMRSRMARLLNFFRLDDFRHRHAELVLDQHHFAARDQAVVDVDVDRLADLAVELQHGAGPELEQLADVHAGAAEHGGDLHRHVEHRFEIGGAARGVCRRRRSGVRIDRRQRAGSLSRFGSGTLLLSLMVDSLLVLIVSKLRHCGGRPRAEVASDGVARWRCSVLAESRTTPPSAHSILQSPSAISGSATTTRRPSKPRVRAISSSCVLADSCSASLTRTTTCGACGELAEAFGRQRRDLGERLAQYQLGRELAGDRGCELDGFGLEPAARSRRGPRAMRSSASPICSKRRGGAARGDRGAFLLGRGEAVAKALALGLGELERMLGRRDRPLRRLGARREVVVEQIFGLALPFSRPALRRASWR